MISSPRFFSDQDPQKSALLVVKNISFQYEADKKVVSECSAEVPASGAYRVHGPTGSGVSTMMKLLSGILSCQVGKISWGNLSVDSPLLMHDAKWRLSCAYVQRLGGLLANQDLLSNAVFPLIYHGWCKEEEARKLGMAYFSHVGIAEEAHRLPAWSSPSARKVCLLIRALLPQPQLLIVDEPTDALTTQAEVNMTKLIQWHREERGLRLIVSGSQDPVWDEKLKMKKIDFGQGKFAGDISW